MASTITIIFAFICVANIIRVRNEPPSHHQTVSSGKSLPSSSLSPATIGLRRNRLEFQPSRAIAHRTVFNLALILSGDVQLNPGPSEANTSACDDCGYCETTVGWEHSRAICCDNCSIWYHSQCLNVSAGRLELLCQPSVSWICVKCDAQNLNNFTYHSFMFETDNRFSILNHVHRSLVSFVKQLSFFPSEALQNVV